MKLKTVEFTTLVYPLMDLDQEMPRSYALLLPGAGSNKRLLFFFKRKWRKLSICICSERRWNPILSCLCETYVSAVRRADAVRAVHLQSCHKKHLQATTCEQAHYPSDVSFLPVQAISRGISMLLFGKSAWVCNTLYSLWISQKISYCGKICRH